MRRLWRPLPRLHPNSGLPEFGIIDRPKSDKSDFGWRDREGASAGRAFRSNPLPSPPPQAGEGARGRARLTKVICDNPALPGLLHPHVPFDQAADLALGIAARHHALEELAVLLLGVAVLLGPERNDRQQILDLREHALLDHLADLLVAAPGRVLAAVMRA